MQGTLDLPAYSGEFAPVPTMPVMLILIHGVLGKFGAEYIVNDPQTYARTIGLSAKDYRTAESAWNALTGDSALRTTGSIDQFAAWLKETPRLDLGNHRSAFLTSSSYLAFKSLLDVLCRMPEIHRHHSRTELGERLHTEIARTWRSALETNAIEDFREFIPPFIETLKSHRPQVRLYRMLRGLTFTDLAELQIGRIVVRNANVEEFPEAPAPGLISEQNAATHRNFLNKTFLTGLCLVGEYKADWGKAHELFEIDCRRAIDTLRFVVSIATVKDAPDPRVRIRFASDAPTGEKATIVVNLDKESTGFSIGGEVSLTEFEISSGNLQLLKSDWNWDAVSTIGATEPLSTMDQLILRAMQWLGDAQDDVDRESAYVKYWICLETLFTGGERGSGDVSGNLARSIAVLLTCGEHPYEILGDFWKLHARLKQLYAVRSDIVHRGLANRLSDQKLADVRRFATHCILALVDLKSRGVNERSKVQEGINRLFAKVELKVPRQPATDGE